MSLVRIFENISRLLLILCFMLVSQFSQANITVIADVNGNESLLKDSLLYHQLIDSKGDWLAESETIVLLGNLTAAESYNADLLNWVGKLQSEAVTKQSRLIVVLGENDLKYLLEMPQPFVTQDEKANQSLAWLAKQDFVVQLNGEIFTNGGISDAVKNRDLEITNQKLKESLTTYQARWKNLISKKLISEPLSVEQRFIQVKKLRASTEKDNFLKSERSILFSNQWPHQYSGNSFCHPLFENDQLTLAFEKNTAKRLWSSLSRTGSSGIFSRFSGEFYLLQQSAEASQQGLFSASISEQGKIKFWQGRQAREGKIEMIPNREYAFPFEMAEHQVITFLEEGEIIARQETKEGRTKPLKLQLEKDGKVMKAIFKSVDEDGRSGKRGVPRTGDKWAHEVAAFHLDRLLDIGLVPLMVERIYMGKAGVVQLWVDNLISALPLNSGEAVYQGICDAAAQENLMNSFDYLIMNYDRNQSNITFTQNDWQIWFIDHTRSFGTGTRVPPFLQGVKIVPTQAFKQALAKLKQSDLKALEQWLSESQMEAIWQRREKLLNADFIYEQ